MAAAGKTIRNQTGTLEGSPFSDGPMNVCHVATVRMISCLQRVTSELGCRVGMVHTAQAPHRCALACSLALHGPHKHAKCGLMAQARILGTKGRNITRRLL